MSRPLNRSNRYNNAIRLNPKSFVNASKSLLILLILTLLVFLNSQQLNSKRNNIKILYSRLYPSNLLCNYYTSLYQSHFHMFINFIKYNSLKNNFVCFNNSYNRSRIHFFSRNFYTNLLNYLTKQN